MVPPSSTIHFRKAPYGNGSKPISSQDPRLLHGPCGAHVAATHAARCDVSKQNQAAQPMAASGTRLILCRYLASTHHVFPTKIVYKQWGFHIYINNKLFYDSLLQGMIEDKRFSKQQIQMEI